MQVYTDLFITFSVWGLFFQGGHASVGHVTPQLKGPGEPEVMGLLAPTVLT